MPIKNLLRLPFFKSASADGAGTAARPADSVEWIRKRARHRLIGAVVLVLAGVVGFPLLFDTQPRPISVDLPIEIPDKAAVKPLNIPAQPVAAATPSVAPAAHPAGSAPLPTQAAPTPTVPVPNSLGPREEIVAAKPQPTPAPATVKPESKPAMALPAASAPVDDGRKARALLDGVDTPVAAQAPSAAEGRFVVQVGAFADAAKAREARLRVEKSGLKTYTQIAETKDGRRIRVRVGPFSSKAEADKAAARIKGLDLPTAILTL